jgi:REP element-mobilizing transposase RayT
MHPLQPDTSYHIFNHANGFENVFRKEENFNFFLEKYRLYISPIAETYAYCLMPNHFHLVVRIRKREAIEELIQNKTNSNFSKVSNFGKVEIEKYLSKQFANLFSCYTQSFNKVYQRMGSLFSKNFKREPILDKTHFLNVIVYAHRNPVHHGFCKRYEEWDYSSYNEIVNGVCDLLEINKLLKMTDGLESFKNTHRTALENFATNYELEIPTHGD